MQKSHIVTPSKFTESLEPVGKGTKSYYCKIKVTMKVTMKVTVNRYGRGITFGSSFFQWLRATHATGHLSKWLLVFFAISLATWNYLLHRANKTRVCVLF